MKGERTMTTTGLYCLMLLKCGGVEARLEATRLYDVNGGTGSGYSSTGGKKEGVAIRSACSQVSKIVPALLDKTKEGRKINLTLD